MLNVCNNYLQESLRIQQDPEQSAWLDGTTNSSQYKVVHIMNNHLSKPSNCRGSRRPSPGWNSKQLQQ